MASQDVYDVIATKAAVWTVDSVAHLIENLKRILIYFLIYLFLPSVAYDPEGGQKLNQLRNSNNYLFTYLFQPMSI